VQHATESLRRPAVEPPIESPTESARVHIETIRDEQARRVVIERVRPSIAGGRFPIKRTVGDAVRISADIFADGHDVITAMVRNRQPTGHGSRGAASRWRESPMALAAPGTDEWHGQFSVGDLGWHEYQIVAWVDRFRSWRRDLRLRAAAGQELDVELLEGALLVRDAAGRAALIARGEAAQGQDDDRLDDDSSATEDVEWLLNHADRLSESTTLSDRIELACDEALAAVVTRYTDRGKATTSAILRVWVDRERARFGAWYEMFPRSAGSDPTRSGTFREAEIMLPRVADLGFDVVYLPPIHPIGRTFRRGRNNSPAAEPTDPGSPWAIGSGDGGHTAIEPGLGTLEDFLGFLRCAEQFDLEVALDLALQCSPDHPWVRDHPEWFRHRPDGTIKYAENPPKKYQDIYPLDLGCDDWRSLWGALFEVVMVWVGRGVRIFRVDNPHTKTFGFWEWLIDRVHAIDPSVIFLAEAFTRPKPMRYLARLGFSQSYTYFTWRTTKDELTDYFTELTTTDVREYLRPNLFTNTPDILHAYLQHGGPPAFQTRLLLAATLGANYGIYSGFELCEGEAAAPGSEEYADSEKYEYRKRNWDGAGRMSELIARVNRIRHDHAALQVDWTLRFHRTDNSNIIAYSKSSEDQSDRVMAIVNLDPHHMQHGFVETPVNRDFYEVRDLLDDVTYRWHRGWNYVRFDPDIRQGHILWLPTSQS
jgi:starch synthase (maltosyl-transferring)